MRFIPMFAAAWTSMANVPWLSKLVSIFAFIALITTMLVVQAINARAMSSMAEEGMLSAGLAKMNKNGAPSTSTITSALTIVIVCMALIASRKTMVHVEGNYRTPGGNGLVIFTILVIVLTYVPAIFNGGLQMWIFTAIIYVIGLLIMAHYLKKEKK